MERYIPRVFGFRIHPSSNSLPRPGVGIRGGLGHYAGGYPGRAGGLGLGATSSSMAALGMAAGAVGHFGVPHSLLIGTGNASNNGNHTSTSFSESGAIAGVTRGGKRRHHGCHTSASDGQQSATPAAGAGAAGVLGAAVSLSGTLLPLDNGDLGLASLVQGAALAAAGGGPSTTSALTYTGLDGKVGSVRWCEVV